MCLIFFCDILFTRIFVHCSIRQVWAEQPFGEFHLQGYPAVRPELDLVDQEDQLTHEISLSEDIVAEITLGMSRTLSCLSQID